MKETNFTKALLAAFGLSTLAFVMGAALGALVIYLFTTL